MVKKPNIIHQDIMIISVHDKINKFTRKNDVKLNHHTNSTAFLKTLSAHKYHLT